MSAYMKNTTAAMLSNTQNTSTSSKRKNAKSAAAQDFSMILLDKLGSIAEDRKRMEEQREAIKEVTAQHNVTEIIRRVMPDGSISVTKYCGGKIESRHRVTPRLKLIDDENSSSNFFDNNLAIHHLKAELIPRKGFME